MNESTDMRTPSEINGYPVVALVKLPHVNGNLPDAHVVVCANPSIARDTVYIVWSVAWQTDRWMACNGRYEIPNLDRALIVMCDRAGDFRNV
jgi:hypothetical protein